MSKCQFCNEDQKQWDGKRVGYLTGVVTENGDGNHVHVHGSFDNKIIVEDIIKAASEAANIDTAKPVVIDKMAGIKEIIFHNRQRIGDMITFTCAVRDFKRAYPHIKINVLSTCGHLWDNNPAIDRSIKEFYSDDLRKRLEEYNLSVPQKNAQLKKGEKEHKTKNIQEFITPADLLSKDTNVLKIGPGKLTNKSNSLDWHMTNAFRLSIEENLGINIPQGSSWGDLWITEDEYNAPRVTEKPYWLIVTGGEKGWGCKMYPTVRWQEVIDQNPEILFHQLGAKGDQHPKLTGANVVDWIGKTEDRETGIRDLIKLFLNAEGSIGLVSFHMHLSGALKRPSVVIAGGREPVSFTRYAGHQYIANDGCLPCSTTACWHCDIKACTNLVTVDEEVMPKCVEMISSEEVTRYLLRYYDGGRLSYDRPLDKPKGLNIVKAPAKIVEAPKSAINTYGLEFNGGALTERDWEFISKAIDDNGCTSVLEFGAGLSTLLLNDKLKGVVTYETQKGWIDKLEKLKPCDVRLWDGVNLALDRPSFDFAFVDGPSGGASREQATRIASEVARVIVVHDAGREHEKAWQEKYIQANFDGPIKGGHRSHLWIRKSGERQPVPNSVQVESIPVKPKIVNVPSNVITIPVAKKLIKFVSTARGWGGCARSITTMMKMLTQAGHEVEFVPFRNSVSSTEFKQCIKDDTICSKVTLNYDTLKEPCDVLVVYSDDYVWEFNKPEVAEWFSGIKADKKIMVCNYRLGPVGRAEWTKGWDRYLFLNHSQEAELLKLLPQASTRVLSPCTDLSSFLAMKPDFSGDIRIVRHNSQGDTKFSKNFGDDLANVHDSREDLTITMMPGPTFIQEGNRFKKVLRNAMPIPEFLASGNLFWYSLPEGYIDAGPRVIIEAMAVGLPILADNWGGAVDRVTQGCGWLCDNKKEFVDIVKNVTMEELRLMGAVSKQRAYEEFDAKNWVEEVVS